MQHSLFSNCNFELPKRPKAFISTSPESTRNTAFRRTTANLGNLIVSSFIDATQFILKLKLWSPQNVPKHSFLQAQRAQETQLLDGPQTILAIKCYITDWCNTIYSEIEVLKTLNCPEAFFSTSSEGRRSTILNKFDRPEKCKMCNGWQFWVREHLENV